MAADREKVECFRFILLLRQIPYFKLFGVILQQTIRVTSTSTRSNIILKTVCSDLTIYNITHQHPKAN